MEQQSAQLIIPPTQFPASKIEGGVGEFIKPLVKDIFLCNSYISRGEIDDEFIAKHNFVSGIELTLIREKGKINDLDIAVYTKDGRKAGYILEKDLPVLAHLMDAGKYLYAVIDAVTKMEAEVYEHKSYIIQVRLKIFMKDI